MLQVSLLNNPFILISSRLIQCRQHVVTINYSNFNMICSGQVQKCASLILFHFFWMLFVLNLKQRMFEDFLTWRIKSFFARLPSALLGVNTSNYNTVLVLAVVLFILCMSAHV